MVEVAVEAYSVCACSDPLSKSVEKEIDIMKCPFLHRVAIFLFGDYFFETRTQNSFELIFALIFANGGKHLSKKGA